MRNQKGHPVKIRLERRDLLKIMNLRLSVFDAKNTPNNKIAMAKSAVKELTDENLKSLRNVEKNLADEILTLYDKQKDH